MVDPDVWFMFVIVICYSRQLDFSEVEMKIGDYVDDALLWLDFPWLHKIPMPSWPKCIKDKDCPGELYTPKEWWGDFGCIYFYFVISFFLDLSFAFLPHDWEGWERAKSGSEGPEQE